MADPKILAFSGSSRTGSLNKKILEVAVAGARNAGATVTVIDLEEYSLPLYHGDIEAKGLPENVAKLKAFFQAHSGLLIASPEYNGCITPLLKNSLDWISRPGPGDIPGGYFFGKVAALISASPGALGGIRALTVVRTMLANLRVVVLPDPVAVPKAHEAFDAQGKIKEEKTQKSLEAAGSNLYKMLVKLSAT